MKFSHFCPLLALAAGLTLAARPAHAQTFLISFVSPTMTAMPDSKGGVFADFSAIFTNTTGSDIYVTGANLTTDAPFSGFFNGAAAPLGDSTTGAFLVLNGQSTTITQVVSLSADPVVALGTYNGTADFQGESAADYAVTQAGGVDNSTSLTATPTPLTLNVVAPNASAAPEPAQTAGLTFVVLGLGGLLLRARRKVHSA